MSDFWQETIRAAQSLRHELHQHPELGWQEWQTAERVRNLLTEWQIPWRACATTGTVAWLNPSANNSKTIGLRADIDALPIQELTQKTYQSEHQGCMHACGHDGHTATLLAAVRWLKQHEQQLPGKVTLLFQPAEEGGHGALKMINDGALEGVDEIYGWHNWPALPFGHMLCPDGLVMCGNGVFELKLTGRGGHASQPENCADPVLAASAIVLNLQQIVSRQIPAVAPAVISATSIVAPSGPTVIPETATIGGSIRVPNDEVRALVTQRITEVSKTTAAVYGVQCEVIHERRYHATINHRDQAQNVRSHWAHMLDHDSSLSLASASAPPVMASEDFSYYLREIPGAFALIGADDGPSHQYPCHSPHYDFNDRLTPLVAQLFAAIAGVPIRT